MGGNPSHRVHDDQVGAFERRQFCDGLVQVGPVEKSAVPNQPHHIFEPHCQPRTIMVLQNRKTDEHIGFQHIPRVLHLLQYRPAGIRRRIKLARQFIDRINLAAGSLDSPADSGVFQTHLGVGERIINHLDRLGAGGLTTLDQRRNHRRVGRRRLVRCARHTEVRFDHHALARFDKPADTAHRLQTPLNQFIRVGAVHDNHRWLAGTGDRSGCRCRGLTLRRDPNIGARFAAAAGQTQNAQ